MRYPVLAAAAENVDLADSAVQRIMHNQLNLRFSNHSVFLSIKIMQLNNGRSHSRISRLTKEEGLKVDVLTNI